MENGILSESIENFKSSFPTILVTMGLICMIGMCGEDLRCVGIPLLSFGIYLGYRSIKNSLKESIHVEDQAHERAADGQHQVKELPEDSAKPQTNIKEQ